MLGVVGVQHANLIRTWKAWCPGLVIVTFHLVMRMLRIFYCMLPMGSGKDCVDLPHKLRWLCGRRVLLCTQRKKINAIWSKFHVSRESVSVF